MSNKRKRTPKVFVPYNDYHDRPFGLKWGTAFALDELVRVIDKNKKIANKSMKLLPQMSRESIDHILQLAFLKSKIISIQLNTQDSLGNHFENIEGKFEGIADETNLYLGNIAIEWDSIRNVSIIEK